jgi:hypothetical protein
MTRCSRRRAVTVRLSLAASLTFQAAGVPRPSGRRRRRPAEVAGGCVRPGRQGTAGGRRGGRGRAAVCGPVGRAGARLLSSSPVPRVPPARPPRPRGEPQSRHDSSHEARKAAGSSSPGVRPLRAQAPVEVAGSLCALLLQVRSTLGAHIITDACLPDTSACAAAPDDTDGDSRRSSGSCGSCGSCTVVAVSAAAQQLTGMGSGELAGCSCLCLAGPETAGDCLVVVLITRPCSCAKAY